MTHIIQPGQENALQRICFDFVWPALAARKAWLTLRDWKPEAVAKLHKGDVFEAWDIPEKRGGRLIATCRLTAEPQKQSLKALPQEAWGETGLFWLFKNFLVFPIETREYLVGRCSPEAWKKFTLTPEAYWAIRFQVLHVENTAKLRTGTILRTGHDLMGRVNQN